MLTAIDFPDDDDDDDYETLTWDEFKALVDQEVAKLGLDHSPHIFYIDTHMPSRKGWWVVSVYYGEDGLTVS